MKGYPNSYNIWKQRILEKYINKCQQIKNNIYSKIEQEKIDTNNDVNEFEINN